MLSPLIVLLLAILLFFLIVGLIYTVLAIINLFREDDYCEVDYDSFVPRKKRK
jgi:hypothetical protein